MKKLLAPVAAVALVLSMTATVLAWEQPTLTAGCAPDANSYAWTIHLATEGNFKIDMSVDADFTSFTSMDFGSAGDHDFTTARGGPILYVRWSSDHNSKAQANANADLCAPPPQPGIKITKSDNSRGTVEPGTGVTYTYLVKNTGNTLLSNVAVKDQISGTDNTACEPVAFQSSDGNQDNILDPGETWTFTCTTTLQSTTSNQACAAADVGNGEAKDVQVVKDCAGDKVEVSHSPEQSIAEQSIAEQSIAEQSVEAGTGTPAATVPNTSSSGDSSNPLPTILFSLVLLASLGTLAYANVKMVRAPIRKR